VALFSLYVAEVPGGKLGAKWNEKKWRKKAAWFTKDERVGKKNEGTRNTLSIPGGEKKPEWSGGLGLLGFPYPLKNHATTK